MLSPPHLALGAQEHKPHTPKKCPVRVLRLPQGAGIPSHSMLRAAQPAITPRPVDMHCARPTLILRMAFGVEAIRSTLDPISVQLGFLHL